MASVSTNPLAIEYVTLVAPHPPDECLRRIRDNLHTIFALPLAPHDMPLSGSVFGTRFTVWRHGRGGWRGIHTIATGRTRPDPVRGTVIHLRISLPFGLYFWLAVMLFFILAGIPVLLVGALASPRAWIGAGFWLLVAGFYVAAVVGLWRHRDDRAFLVETLTQLLNAQVNP